MLHLFDLTESHTESLRIPSSTNQLYKRMCVCVCVSIQYLRGRNGVTVREEDCLCEALLIILKVSKEKTDSKEHYERLTLLCWTSLLSLLTCNNLSSVFAYSFPKT